ncbi:hypothetical protein P691DRAFT_810360 [Macrolepiota fuliginosa MF-IS2]|uniref:Zn(2)-C6 fungal-type domain-containing protein n=1 Tax=Macrolepiota fuliginosa MF-IS2 TaxID=1400762 RepID=A0A9P5XHI0_9AGAR|nr:hypothetical protein P691DRAFT_810360 [Macrolepiota fuliginosa MF-IS2]
MQHVPQHPIALPPPILIPSAPIPPGSRLAFGTSSNVSPRPYDDIDDEPPTKRRRKDRACDYCRRRKIKCDGPSQRDQICTNCVHGHRRCTYIELSKPRGPSKAYVTTLEDQVEQLEGVVKQLYPNIDFSEELGLPVIRGSWKNAMPNHSNNPPKTSLSRPSVNSSPLSVLNIPKTNSTLTKELDPSSVNRSTHLTFPPRNISHRSSRIRLGVTSDTSIPASDDSFDESEEETIITSSGGRHRLTLSAIEDPEGAQPDGRIRFHGRSSTAGLVEVTRKFKYLHMQGRVQGEHPGNVQEDGAVGFSGHRTSRPSQPSRPGNAGLQACRRIEFWSAPKWELDWESHGNEAPRLLTAVLTYFPSDDVANRLFELFFSHTNMYLPLLHRPTFERYWNQRLHHRNVWFAVVCILMFAVASRWYEADQGSVDDSSVKKEYWKAVGWRWFFVALDVHCIRRSIFCSATLFEIQTLALMTIFLRGTTCGPIGWLFLSIGIRKAQDRGAHRRTVYKTRPNADDELWKRAFWVLLAFDWIMGASLGRGVVVGEEDYDLDLPLEVDDEFWETGNPEADFKQPSDTPSKMTCFLQYIKLIRIIAFMAKTLYPVDRSKVLYGFLKGGWTEEVVRQLRLTMEEWIEHMPSHLRWSEDIADLTFARQSASIYSLYQCAQMTIWRQFCMDSPVLLSSSLDNKRYAMTLCAMSIRDCARILDVDMRTGLSNTPNMINSALVCAGTVAMILWELQRKMVASGRGKTLIREVEIEDTGIHLHELLDDVGVCMKVLEMKRSRWEWAEAVFNKLNDALPSDKDGVFENMDIPMPSMDGIHDASHTPIDIDGRDPAPTFHVLQDGTISFMEQNDYLDDFSFTFPFPAGGNTPLQTTNRPPNPGSSSPEFQPNQANCQISQTSFLQDPRPQTSSTAPPTTISHQESAQHGHSATHGAYPSRHSLSRLTPQMFQPLPKSYLLPPGGEPFASNAHYSTLHSSPDQRLTQRCGPPQTTDAPVRRHASRGMCPGIPPAMPAGFDMPGSTSALQAEHRPTRARTTSLVNYPPPSTLVDGSVPSAGSSLRRTSVPNLQLMRKGSQSSISMTENRSRSRSIMAVDGTHQGLTEPIEKSVDTGQFIYFPHPDHRSPVTRPRETDWNNDTHPVLESGDRNSRKPVRPTEFRHWNKLPPPPPPSWSDMDNLQYTQHRFIHENPYGR